MTFGDLKTKVALYINRDDLVSIIPDFINMAQNKVERENNWKCMERITTYTTSDAYLTIPDMYKETVYLKIKDGGKYYDLVKTSLEHALSIYPYYNGNNEKPKVFTTVTANNQLVLRPLPDKEYNYELLYYAYTPKLLNDTDTNWWTNNAWEILLYGALLEAETYLMEDGRVPLWAEFYKDKVNTLRNVELAETFSGFQAIRNGAVVI